MSKYAFLSLLLLLAPSARAAHCFCSIVTPTGQEIGQYVEDGYTQLTQKAKCRSHCEGVWDGLSSSDLIAMAQKAGICDQTVTLSMESWVGTSHHTTVQSGTYVIPCPPPQASWLRYAAKFVCGAVPLSERRGPLMPGEYFTTVDVHNPSNSPVRIYKRFSFGLAGERMGLLSDGFAVTIDPARTIEIECKDILDLSTGTPTSTTGFALVESPAELEVVTVHTAGPAGQQVETLHTERVPGKAIARPSFTPCGANPPNLSTGFATWNVQLQSGGPVAVAPLVTDHGVLSLWGNLGGDAQWISTTTNGAGDAVPWVYRTCFCACPNVTPSLSVQALADNMVSISLNNGNPFYTWPASGTFGFQGPSPVVQYVGAFQSGLNCIAATVTNTSSVTGLVAAVAVTGVDSVGANGSCGRTPPR